MNCTHLALSPRLSPVTYLLLQPLTHPLWGLSGFSSWWYSRDSSTDKWDHHTRKQNSSDINTIYLSITFLYLQYVSSSAFLIPSVWSQGKKSLLDHNLLPYLWPWYYPHLSLKGHIKTMTSPFPLPSVSPSPVKPCLLHTYRQSHPQATFQSSSFNGEVGERPRTALGTKWTEHTKSLLSSSFYFLHWR